MTSRTTGTALLTHFGLWMQPERRQDKGPMPKPRWMPLPELLYAQVVKNNEIALVWASIMLTIGIDTG